VIKTVIRRKKQTIDCIKVSTARIAGSDGPESLKKLVECHRMGLVAEGEDRGGKGRYTKDYKMGTK